MTKRVRGVSGRVLVVLGLGLAAVAPASQALQPEPQMMVEVAEGANAAPLAGMMGSAFGVPGPRGGPRGEQRGAHGGPQLLPPFIRLSEQQQDKLFELRHAQAPALRIQFKELRNAHEQLRVLALADNYDETRARQIVARATQASGEIELMHARLQHAAFALLTPEQRKRIDECKPGAEGSAPRGCMPPPR